jgi:hypothetical protein
MHSKGESLLRTIGERCGEALCEHATVALTAVGQQSMDSISVVTLETVRLLAPIIAAFIRLQGLPPQ